MTPAQHNGSNGRRAVFALGASVALWAGGCKDRSSVELAPVPAASNPTERAIDPSAESHRKMVARLDAIEAALGDNPYLGDGVVGRLREKASQLKPGIPMVEAVGVYLEFAKSLLRSGREADAVQTLQATRTMLQNAGGGSPLVDFTLGVAHLRAAETANCCKRHNQDSCVLPIRGGGVHQDRRGSEAAAAMFAGVLAREHEGSDLYYGTIWLWNIAAMTLGTWPDSLPEKFRIPEAAFRSKVPFPRFPEVAGQLGLATFSLAGGAIAEDFDGDGHLDLLVSDWDPRRSLRLFLNDRAGGFRDATESWNLTGIRGGLNLVQADYDNDGDVDVLVLRGGWFGRAGCHPNSLLRNDGGRFVDVTFAAGLGAAQLPTQTAAFADYDNDGDLDLYVGHESTAQVAAPSCLFRNNGDGTFTDVAKAAGVTNDRFAKAVGWGDYDNDRFPDLYVSNLGEPNRLFRNRGDGTFEDVAGKLAVTEPLHSFPMWFWDFDNDGNLDILVFGYGDSIAEVCAHYLGVPRKCVAPRLYRGDGGKSFRDVAAECGLARPMLPMGSNFGDLDNDGYPDFYIGTGQPTTEELMPSLMFRNRDGKGFDDVTMAGGFGNLQKGHGVVFADFDNDGDQDVFEEMGGAFAGDRYFDCLYRNPGFGNHWLALQLVGRRSNRSAIGARIRADVVDAGGARRVIYKHVNSGGSFGANPLLQTVGLGQAQRLERLEVYWPTSDTRQVFTGVAFDRALRIVEGEDRPRVLERVRTTLGK